VFLDGFAHCSFATIECGPWGTTCRLGLLLRVGSFLTEGLGLSNTLGAFLAGVLLADTKHRHHIETEMNPIRGILVGIFFFSVGFEIDLNLIKNKFPLVASIVLGITALKTAQQASKVSLRDILSVIHHSHKKNPIIS
jgi:Kef-type K+ transport system membrane component KefB